jgi:hypothetical protein
MVFDIEFLDFLGVVRRTENAGFARMEFSSWMAISVFPWRSGWGNFPNYPAGFGEVLRTKIVYPTGLGRARGCA